MFYFLEVINFFIMEDLEANGEREWEGALLSMKLLIDDDELYEKQRQ